MSIHTHTHRCSHTPAHRAHLSNLLLLCKCHRKCSHMTFPHILHMLHTCMYMCMCESKRRSFPLVVMRQSVILKLSAWVDERKRQNAAFISSFSSTSHSTVSVERCLSWSLLSLLLLHPLLVYQKKTFEKGLRH